MIPYQYLNYALQLSRAVNNPLMLFFVWVHGLISLVSLDTQPLCCSLPNVCCLELSAFRISTGAECVQSMAASLVISSLLFEQALKYIPLHINRHARIYQDLGHQVDMVLCVQHTWLNLKLFHWADMDITIYGIHNQKDNLPVNCDVGSSNSMF